MENETDQNEITAGLCSYEAEWGSVTVEISEDFMTVQLNVLERNSAFGGDFSIADLISHLQNSGIVFGVLTDDLLAQSEALLAVSGWTGKLIIAQGRPAGQPGEATFSLFADDMDIRLATDSCQVGEQTLHFQVLHNYVSKPMDSPEETDLLAKAVKSGETIATRQEPLRGRAGRDVLGRTVDAPPFSWLLAEENVIISNNRQIFEATIFGYLVVIERHLSILSPLQLSVDGMTASWLNVSQLLPYRIPDTVDITSQLEKAGVKSGVVDAEAIASVCSTMDPATTCSYVVARGQEAENGQDSYLEFSVSREKRAGEKREDGSIDLRELNLVQTVDESGLIAILHPATPGVPGFTLFDEELPVEPGQELKIEAKENVRLEEKENGEVHFFSEAAGLIKYQDGKISVEAVYKVSGDVDFHTGNLDVDCILEVSGGVCADFSVTASKDVIIGASIEHGAKIFVQGDLTVKGGIIGETTEITVLGNLDAQFVQAAKVVVKGKLTVAQYIYYATVRSVDSINVGPGSGERGGSIVGGTVCSSSDITASSCGSPSNVPTNIVIEPPPHLLAKLLRLKKAAAKHDAAIIKIMRTLNLSTINSAEVKALLAAQPPEQRELFVKILMQLNAMVKSQKKAVQERQALTNTLKKKMSQVRFQVNKTYYGNTLVRMGKREFHEKNDRGPTTFTYRKSRVHVESNVADSEGF